MIRVGDLVRSQQNDLNIGKTVELSGESATVEYFISVVKRQRETISISALQRVHLQRHTRCYWQSEECIWEHLS
jgi:ATP-dependent helicase HepA